MRRVNIPRGILRRERITLIPSEEGKKRIANTKPLFRRSPRMKKRKTKRRGS